MSNGINYKKWNLWVEAGGFLAVTASIVVLIWQTAVQNKSLKIQNQSLVSNSYSRVMNEQLKLTNIFIEKPDLGPFFMDDGSANNSIKLKSIKDSDPELYYQIIAVADIHLDFFELVLGESTYFLSYLDDEESNVFDTVPWDNEAWETWQQYIKDTFAQSPVLCQRLKQVQKWYTEEYREFSECSFEDFSLG